jgi:predicted pyridoxine 5'-phosphate oxidase superfamily flavin-nucleotide-binding protein
MARALSTIAFTPAVRARQTEEGSREAYAPLDLPEADSGDRLGPAEAAFISERDGFYQATVSETGWPYVQFRGGPRGFLKVLDEKTLAYADFRGNRQYISSGNLKENDRVSLILMDYPNRRRLKVWARARQIDAKDDPNLIATLREDGYRGLPERAVVLTIEALDWNCPQHIPKRYTLEELAPDILALQNRISELEAENAELKDFLKPAP